ncbi:MAG: EscU/YscU/HrcU family type III secretion system export apparatus switch protein [Lentisphaerae bacterium]|nr:EscU/YscU/HrcU family type III secretion system export apparatus switch protein [Lentisphaerota bacterium]
MEGKNGQTEKATSRRRGKEREKGNLPVSQEVLSVTVLLAATLMLRISFPGYLTGTRQMLEYSYLGTAPGTHWSGIWVQEMYWHGMSSVLAAIMPLLGFVMIVGVAASMAQTGPYFSWSAFHMGGLKALNPLKGVKRLFSAKAMTTLWITLLKLTLIVGIISLVWRGQWTKVAQLSAFGLRPAVLWVGQRIYLTLLAVCIFAIVVAVIDSILTRRRHEQGMMMTKHEVKDERKQYEVKPEVKRVQFRKMRELTASRLIAAVPDATVVVTNPTRVAVALKYDPATMERPKVVAKGLRLHAKRIRELARAHGVPIVERPVLARALYKTVPVGRSIPGTLFGGVAEVLAYLHRLGHRLKGFEAAAPAAGQTGA